MKLLYPTKNKEFHISDKEALLKRVKDQTENIKKFRFIFSSHKPFEGQVKFNGFKINYIGNTARNYKVTLEGEMIERGKVTLLRIRSMPTGFGKIYTSIWLLFMTMVMIFTIFLTIVNGNMIILTITFACLLLLSIVLIVSYFGYKNETLKVWKLIEKIITEK